MPSLLKKVLKEEVCKNAVTTNRQKSVNRTAYSRQFCSCLFDRIRSTASGTVPVAGIRVYIASQGVLIAGMKAVQTGEKPTSLLKLLSRQP